jgi:pimeloyl-ACP methyl ester carboxylesterase
MQTKPMIKKLAALVAAFVFSACFSGNKTGSMTEGYITTKDEVRLFYRKIGNGSKTVLIPNGMYYFEDFKRFADDRTLIFYDVRNRGASDPVTDPSRLSGGIQQDVEDLEIVRTHFVESEQIDIIGHSYIGLMIGLYAMKYPSHVNRLVQISPAQPDGATQYPAHLTHVDNVITEIMGKLAKLQAEPRPEDPVESCKQFWSVLGPINVYNPVHAAKIDWGRCELENERNFMQYWSEQLFPSIQKIHLSSKNAIQMKAPVLIIHGNKDRSAPYGGARDWTKIWPNGRLLTIQNVAHAPWIEAPDVVFEAIRVFLGGDWPKQAEKL